MESQISFTLDTICPWTYLGKKRLDEALRRFRASDAGKDVTFTVKYFPYQLYPEASKEGEDKYQWYRKSKYGDSEDKMKVYTTLMTAYGVSAGINYKFTGMVANTLDAHRVIQHFQEEKGPETADKIINSLYSQFFENEKHPSTDETLLKATTDAGIPESEAKAFIEDRNEGMRDTKMLIREQAGNGVDSVPYIVLEGKKRDITLIGAKEVEEYEKALQQIVKENAPASLPLGSAGFKTRRAAAAKKAPAYDQGRTSHKGCDRSRPTCDHCSENGKICTWPASIVATDSVELNDQPSNGPVKEEVDDLTGFITLPDPFLLPSTRQQAIQPIAARETDADAAMLLYNTIVLLRPDQGNSSIRQRVFETEQNIKLEPDLETPEAPRQAQRGTDTPDSEITLAVEDGDSDLSDTIADSPPRSNAIGGLYYRNKRNGRRVPVIPVNGIFE